MPQIGYGTSHDIHTSSALTLSFTLL